MKVIFCDSGFSHKEVDPLFHEEWESAKKAGYSVGLISFEALKRGDITRALRYIVPLATPEVAIYRGWMLQPHQYEQLYTELRAIGLELINSPAQYLHCHYLPENYPIIQAYTPDTRFKKLKDNVFKMDDFRDILQHFGTKPIVVKDYVKSQKHYWEAACFIPNASDETQAAAVITKFIELQGEDLNEGLVFREFVELETLTTHSQSGMPLTKEFRVFIKNGKVLSVYPYWDEGNYQQIVPLVDQFAQVIPEINSCFFSMDIALQKDGRWIIVELGDGQVAGLPENADKTAFYALLGAA